MTYLNNKDNNKKKYFSFINKYFNYTILSQRENPLEK